MRLFGLPFRWVCWIVCLAGMVLAAVANSDPALRILAWPMILLTVYNVVRAVIGWCGRILRGV